MTFFFSALFLDLNCGEMTFFFSALFLDLNWSEMTWITPNFLNLNILKSPKCKTHFTCKIPCQRRVLAMFHAPWKCEPLRGTWRVTPLCSQWEESVPHPDKDGGSFMKFQHSGVNKNKQISEAEERVHKYITNFWQRDPDNSMENEKYFQQIMMGQLDIHLKKQ